MSRLDLVIGPNGAGKSTFVRLSLGPHVPFSTFVNADVIAAHRWPAASAEHAYQAAKIAAATRARLIELGQPFIAETVFSHPSKLDLIRDAHTAGYHVVVHALLIPEDQAVARVEHRVTAGGHQVPENKIRERHRRLMPLLAQAITLADTAYVYDSSRHDGPHLICLFSAGVPVGRPAWPAWTSDSLTKAWR